MKERGEKRRIKKGAREGWGRTEGVIGKERGGGGGTHERGKVEGKEKVEVRGREKGHS